MYVKDLSKSKYELLIKKHEDARAKHFNDPNAFIECWNTLSDIYKNIVDYNLTRKKILIVFNNMIANIMTNKKFQAILK